MLAIFLAESFSVNTSIPARDVRITEQPVTNG